MASIPEAQVHEISCEENKGFLNFRGTFLIEIIYEGVSNALRTSYRESFYFILKHYKINLWGNFCRFVASLETDLTVRAKTTEVSIADFSSGSYTTIFTEEVRHFSFGVLHLVCVDTDIDCPLSFPRT